MVTRCKAGYRQPRNILNLNTICLSPLPTYRGALADPNLHDAVVEEFTALQANHTWNLVLLPCGANIVIGKWVYRHMIYPDGTLDRYMAREVLRGFTEHPSLDLAETFSPVVKPTTIHLLDVKNAFLYSANSEIVYCSQPSGFTDPSRPDHVSHLNKSVYSDKCRITYPPGH